MSDRHVLFVDDDTHSLDGFRRMLRKNRQQWHMEFVSSGAEALEKMAGAPFDVLVTDLNMPGMSGPELLERVARDYPRTARIIFSAHADEAIANRVVNLAHRYLAKPAAPEVLIETLVQTCATQAAMPDERMGAIIASCSPLPTPPKLYIELTHAMASQDCDARTLGQLIARDMAISAKLLQLVNSSFFGIARRVSSVEHTVSLLGMLRIKAMVLSEHIFKQLTPSPALAQPVASLWRHSYVVAEIARQISKAEGQGGDRPDQAFTAGLLHDVGRLVIIYKQPELFLTQLADCEQEPSSLTRSELEHLGVTHGDIGAQLLALWGLPPRIVEAVRLHHEPGRTTYNGMCAVTAVHAAEQFATHYREYNDEPQSFTCLDKEYLTRIGLLERTETWRSLALTVIERVAQEEKVTV